MAGTIPQADVDAAHQEDHISIAWARVFRNWPTEAQVELVKRHMRHAPVSAVHAVRYLASEARAAVARKAAEEAAAKAEAKRQAQLAEAAKQMEAAVADASTNMPLPAENAGDTGFVSGEGT